MIENLTINQEEQRLEYAINGENTVCGDNGECHNIEKLELYEIMKGVIKNWNENNKDLQL